MLKKVLNKFVKVRNAYVLLNCDSEKYTPSSMKRLVMLNDVNSNKK